MDKMVSRKAPKRLVSLFAGIGGFELGFQSQGITTTMACEIDPVAQHVLRANMPDLKIVDDVRDMRTLPERTDILCAGFPCQDISTIGVKTGLSGDRSSLVKEVFRLLQAKQVEWVIFENVPNMLFLRQGEAIRTIVDTLEELGYSWAYRMIDSLAFLPQRRRRVFVVASLHYDPRNVLLSGNSANELGLITSDKFCEPCGFYWTELSKAGWSAEIPSGVSGRASYLIDGNGGSYGSDVFSYNPFWFVIDMKSAQTFNALGMDYYYTYASKKVRISTSLDNENWTPQGVLEVPRVGNHYFQFFSSITARYVKVELLEGFGSYIDVTEVYIYNAQ